MIRPAVVLLSLCALAGCGPQDPFTPLERSALEGFVLPGAPPASPTNAYADSPAAAALGQQFFFDTRFSGPLVIADDGMNGGLGAAGETGLVGCISCHDPEAGGTDRRSMPPNVSIAAGHTGRNAATVLNSAYQLWQFWDGRKDSLWAQALGPSESPVEHNGSRLLFAHLIYDLYRTPYEAVFGPLPDLADAVRFPPEGKPGDPAWDGMAAADQDAVNRVFVNFGKALEAYERLLIDRDSPFDRFMGGDESALSAAEIRGAKLFVGRASCNECHVGGNLTDGSFHNIGTPQMGPNVPAVDEGRAAGIATVLADPFNGAGAYSDDPSAAGYLDGLAAAPADEGAFKTPTLRSVALTAPYMHNGVFTSLRDVVLHYRDGGGPPGSFSGTLDPSIFPLTLSDQDVDDLVAFLGALTGAPLPASLTTAPLLP